MVEVVVVICGVDVLYWVDFFVMFDDLFVDYVCVIDVVVCMVEVNGIWWVVF